MEAKVSLILALAAAILVIADCSEAEETQAEFGPNYGVYRVHTYAQGEDDEAKEHKWLYVLTEVTYFKFQVQACDSAHIALASHPGDITTLHYEVVFGKSQYGIKDLRTGQYVVQLDGLKLDCDVYKDFWISWANGTLKVGEGDAVGSQEILTHPDANIASITRAVSVTTGKDVDGYWQIHRDMGRLHTLQVPPQREKEEKPLFDYFWINLDGAYVVIFQVKMCTEARINVSPNEFSTTDSLEIRIGTLENSRTSLHNFTTGLVLEEADTPGVLSCDEFRYFWFRRSNGYYEFGLGSRYGDQRVLYFPGGDAFLNLGFDTMDNAGGAYQFKHIEGDYFTILTDYDGRMLTDVFITTHLEHIDVQVRGCTGAVVAVVTAHTQEEQNEYFIVIGDSNNQQTTVQQRQFEEGFKTLKTAETPNILDCDKAQSFWIAWEDNKFAFGKGLLYVSEPLLEWVAENDTLAPVQGLSVTTDDQQNIAEWRINRQTALTCRTRSGNFDHLWYDTSEMNTMVFQLRFASDAVFVLAEFHGIDDYHSYTVRIGPNKESKIILTKSDGSAPVEAPLQRPLNDEVTQTFWVQWMHTTAGSSDVKISIGHGSDVENDVVLEYTDSAPYPVNAVGITSEYNMVADWTFSKIEDNSLVIVTEPVYGYNFGFLALSSNWFKVHIQACSDACIMLSSNTDHMNWQNGPSVEICLGTDRNTHSSARDISSADTPLLAITPNILTCFSMRTYWLEWTGGNVTVGQGELHAFPVLVFPVPSGKTFNFRFIKFSTTDTVRGLFRVPYESHGLVHMETVGTNAVPVTSHRRTSSLNHNSPALPGRLVPRKPARKTGEPDLRAPMYGRYWITSVSRPHVIFSVKACEEAHVALSPLYGGSKFFEVRLGIRNNTYMEIKGNLHTVGLPTADILSCTEYRDFWITWAPDRVAVGTGRIPGDNFLLSYTQLADDYSFHALAFATAKEFNGSWEISQYDADHYLLRTLPSQDKPVEIYTREKVFFFTVMTCCNAEIRLHKNDQDFYSLILGANGGTKIQLLKRATEVMSLPNLLGVISCSEHKNFWLAWDQNTIRIGKGNNLYQQTVLDWIDSDESDRFTDSVITVRLRSTGCPTAAYWTYLKHLGNATVYHSPENEDYYGMRIMTRSATSAMFRVKTCNQALITLSDIPGIVTERTLEAVIENGVSKLRKGIGGEEVGFFETQGDSLDCDHYRPFWISWKDSTIQIGAGSAVGDQRFIVYYLTENSFSVNCLALSTGESTGSWMFAMFPGNVYHAHTSPEFAQYQLHTQVWLANPRKYLEFAVRAEQSARIALSYIPQDITRSTYEVVLGADKNQNSRISYTDSSGNTEENTKKETPGILDATQYNTFWVYWDDLRIRVGKGQLFSGQILTLSGTTFFEVNAISLSSGNLTRGDWTFMQDNDDAILVKTRPYFEDPDFSFTVTDRNYFVFQVKSCEHAEIRLSSQMGNEKTDAYQIIIGADRNERSIIKRSPDSSEEQSKDTPGLLSCTQFKTFWLSWKDAFISFGTGPRVNENVVHSWQDDTNDRDVLQAYLNTGDQDSGHYELVDLDGESYTVVTGGDHSYEFVTLTTTSRNLQFRVKACKDAHVALLREDNNVVYEIVFGSSGNTRTVIRNESLTFDVASVDTPELLHCTEMRTLWVSWDSGAIVAGIGTVNTHVLVQHPLVGDPDVRSVSLSTYGDITGEFKFSETMASKIELRSRDLGASAYRQFWRTLQGREYFTFRVQARDSVHVILTNVPLITDAKAYEIRIGVNANTETMIEKLQGTTVINRTEGILAETEMRDFWVSWIGNKISFGTGIAIGEKEVSALWDSEYNINAFSLATQVGIAAQWEFTSDIIEPSTTSTISTTSGTTATTSSPDGVQTSTTRTNPPVYQPDDGGEGLSAGAIVGIVFGVLGFLMIAALAILLLVRLRQIKNYKEFMNEDEQGDSRVSWDNPNYDSPANIQMRDTNDPFRGTGLPSESTY